MKIDQEINKADTLSELKTSTDPIDQKEEQEPL